MGKSSPLIAELYYAAYQKYMDSEKVLEALQMLIRTLSMLKGDDICSTKILQMEIKSLDWIRASAYLTVCTIQVGNIEAIYESFR